VREGYLLQYLTYGIRLGDVLFHELSPCRNIVKKVADNYGSSVRTASLVMERLEAALDIVERSVSLILLLRHKLHPRHGCDRSQSLSAESEREDIVKVCLFGDLARSVAQESFRNIIKSHSAAVICDAHIGSSAVFYLNGYV